jgi:hypothetical protein
LLPKEADHRALWNIQKWTCLCIREDSIASLLLSCVIGRWNVEHAVSNMLLLDGRGHVQVMLYWDRLPLD